MGRTLDSADSGEISFMPVCLNPEKAKHEAVCANYKQVSFKSYSPAFPLTSWLLPPPTVVDGGHGRG